MAKFSKAWRGVKAGDIYPTEFKTGDECPPELVEAAHASEVLEALGDADTKAIADAKAAREAEAAALQAAADAERAARDADPDKVAAEKAAGKAKAAK